MSIYRTLGPLVSHVECYHLHNAISFEILITIYDIFHIKQLSFTVIFESFDKSFLVSY